MQGMQKLPPSLHAMFWVWGDDITHREGSELAFVQLGDDHRDCQGPGAHQEPLL